MTPDEVHALVAAIQDASGPSLGTIIAAVASSATALLLSLLIWLAKRQVDRIDTLEQKSQTKEACASTHQAFRDQLDREQQLRDDAARKVEEETKGALELVDRALDLIGARRGKDG